MYVGFLAKNIPESWVIYEAVQGILCWNLANEIYWYNKDLASIWSLNHNFNIVQFFLSKVLKSNLICFLNFKDDYVSMLVP